MNFLPSINAKATRKRVDHALEKYRIYLLSEKLDRQPSITANYTLEPPSKTNQFHSSTEQAAIANVEYEKERDEYIRRIINAVNRLSYIERELIIRRYMGPDECYDYEVYQQLNMSERKYYRVKARAFYKLAFALKIEVYAERGAS